MIIPAMKAPAQAEPSAPGAPAQPLPAPSPALTLENPRGQTKEQLGAALTAAEQQQAAPSGSPAPVAQAPQGPQQFDAQAMIAKIQEEQARQFRALQKELGQARKVQGDFTKLPDLIKQQLDAREKAQRERQLREQLSPDERLALMDQEADEASRRKSIEQLVEERIEQRLQAQQAEQQGVRDYESALTSMAGERMGELEPHITNILGQVNAALQSDDPETVERGLQYYDYYSQNMGALLWHADAAIRKAGPQGGAPAAPAALAAPQGPAPAAPAAPASPAAQFRQQRQAAGSDASPQARSSAPSAGPAGLNDIDPASIRNMPKDKLAALLTAAESQQR